MDNDITQLNVVHRMPVASRLVLQNFLSDIGNVKGSSSNIKAAGYDFRTEQPVKEGQVVFRGLVAVVR